MESEEASYLSSVFSRLVSNNIVMKSQNALKVGLLCTTGYQENSRENWV